LEELKELRELKEPKELKGWFYEDFCNDAG
jgi:hypothetical protein